MKRLSIFPLLLFASYANAQVCPECGRGQMLLAQNATPPSESLEPIPNTGLGSQLLGQLQVSAIIGHMMVKGILDKNARPNILVIMADDVGIWNLSCYHRGLMGGRTPNIDKIASQGAIFTAYYGQQSCTAGRATFLTGLSPMRTGLAKVGLPGAAEGLQDSDPTLAEHLKALGYSTGQFGKNHLGDLNKFLPTVHGFDVFFGFLYHLNALEEPWQSGYPPAPFYANFGPRAIVDCRASLIDDRRTDPRWGQVGKQTITEEGPLPPWPNMATPKGMPSPKYDMTTYDEVVTDKTIDFMTTAARRNNPFFVWYNPSRMHVWTNLSDKWKGKSGYGLYADGMMELDSNVGQLLDTLDKLGIADNTIVLFTTDNGAELMTWPDGGNTPFRGEKGTTFDGGFIVPLVVKWPGVLEPGTVINDIMSAEDWVPTLTAAAGNDSLTQDLLKGTKIGDKSFKAHLDGYNMLPYFAAITLKRKDVSDPRQEFFYFSDNSELCAVRYGDWKINFKTFEGNLLTGETRQANVPLIENLRMDPFERFHEESMLYGEWFMRNAWVLVPTQKIVGQFMATFKEYPPSQAGGNFGVMSMQHDYDELSGAPTMGK